VVRDAVTFAPLAATVTAGVFSTSTDPADGTFDLMLPAGTYDVTATAADHAPVTAPGLVLTTGATTTHSFLLAPYTTILSDTVENGNIGWIPDPPWAITTEAAHSPTHSWTDSPGGDYTDYRDVSLTSPLLNLTSSTGVTLEFSHIYDLESTYDYGYVEVSTNNGSSWSTVASYTGTHTSPWEQVTIPLPELDGAAQARFRFHLTSDSYITADGWHVDDIVLRAAAPVPDGLLFSDGFATGTTSAWSAAVP